MTQRAVRKTDTENARLWSVLQGSPRQTLFSCLLPLSVEAVMTSEQVESQYVLHNQNVGRFSLFFCFFTFSLNLFFLKKKNHFFEYSNVDLWKTFDSY